MIELLIIFVLLYFIFGTDTSGRSGGVHVKPKSKTPRPKVAPAPQPLRRKK